MFLRFRWHIFIAIVFYHINKCIPLIFHRQLSCFKFLPVTNNVVRIVNALLVDTPAVSVCWVSGGINGSREVVSLFPSPALSWVFYSTFLPTFVDIVFNSLKIFLAILVICYSLFVVLICISWMPERVHIYMFIGQLNFFFVKYLRLLPIVFILFCWPVNMFLW